MYHVLVTCSRLLVGLEILLSMKTPNDLWVVKTHGLFHVPLGTIQGLHNGHPMT